MNVGQLRKLLEGLPMDRRNYKSCAHFREGATRTCKHPERHTWPDMRGCNGCNSCPLNCMQATGRPDECPHGRPRGTNELGGAE